MSGARRPTLAEVRERGDTCRVEELAGILGISRGSAYEGVRRGELPGLRVGKRWLVPVARVAALLGEDTAS